MIHQPSDSKLLRKPDSIFIEQLKKRMVEDPSAPGSTPLAVLCKDKENAETFEIKHKNVYRYNIRMYICGVVYYVFVYCYIDMRY